MTPSDWFGLVQAIGVIAALIFTGVQMRSQRREIQFRNYLDAISGFVDLARLMVEKSELHPLYDHSTTENGRYKSLTSEQKARVHYCDAVIALGETLWYANQQKWLPPDEWKYWRDWLIDLNQSPDFKFALEWNFEDYDEHFIEEICQKKHHKEGSSRKHRAS